MYICMCRCKTNSYLLQCQALDIFGKILVTLDTFGHFRTLYSWSWTELDIVGLVYSCYSLCFVLNVILAVILSTLDDSGVRNG